MYDYCWKLQPLRFVTCYGICEDYRKLARASNLCPLAISLNPSLSLDIDSANLFEANLELIAVMYSFKSPQASVL